MTKIYSDNGFLNFSTGRLATQEEYELGDRCTGSIFEALQPGESVVLQEGIFELDKDLDLTTIPVQNSKNS